MRKIDGSINNELARIPRHFGESKCEWLVRARDSWFAKAALAGATYSEVAWFMVICCLFEQAREYHVSRDSDGFYCIELDDLTLVAAIDSHADEVVRQAPDIMPENFRALTSKEVRSILSMIRRSFS